ncbi:MAG TPA: c-type cytochrome, partial [Gemmataceae bacterium]|nr:c-type cytochrome [Gemmataceae bacterium]
MAATDQTYRNQKALDIVFAASCVIMLASIVWMFGQDYFREYKKVQREFRDVEAALAERGMLERLPDPAGVETAATAVADARKQVDQIKSNMPADLRTALYKKANGEAQYQSVKADYDSFSSLLNEAVDDRDIYSPDDPNWKIHDAAVQKRLQQVKALEKKLADAQLALDQANKELRLKQQAQKDAEDALSRAEDNLKKVSGEFDRFAKLTAQKTWKWGDWLRELPVMDAFASPVKIQQFTLEGYPIDYSFKYVTRYDRCTTCHLGIDRANFTKEALSKLTPENTPEDMNARLAETHNLYTTRTKLFDKRAKAVESFGFDPSDLPNDVVTVKLSDAQVTEYCAHPRLELFVGPNSPHPAEKFGCTSCHAGQGSATDFPLAVHAPNTPEQREEWINKLGWERNHFWDYPMLPKRFIESTCLKCHHQVTDLIRNGSMEEAPRLIKGYNLVRESGCFGCHEISGLKSGREIGPDLRLEPSPPVDAYSASDRVKLFSDPLNPPGALRKVGPSLFRVSEKTNQQWARKWIAAPRNFRPTTKMPHFYGLSNNTREVLPDDQKDFPDTEIASIAYYIFRESSDYLHGKDTYSRFMEQRIKDLQDRQNNKTASEQEQRQLEELLRLRDLERKPKLLTEQIVDGQGSTVQLPAARTGDAAKAQLKSGRQLFTERGCLGCHTHAGTTKADDTQVPSVKSDADFAPDLSRLAAKIAPEENPSDPNAKRRWVVQWVLDPKIHHPRTRMPVTHLTVEQADDVAAWLLSQPVTDWNQENIPEAKPDALADLARVYLLKAPGMTREEADDILSGEPNRRKGIADVSNLPLDSDERQLAAGQSGLTDDKLKWYVGRKAILRQGCFGCHDIPGFEAAKPIGTALNDWGKKDPQRLAFEDVIAYVRDKFDARPSLTDDKGNGLAVEAGQKPPYESFFMEALEHHEREGFLHQKLMEPRSYDYNRLRPWDERLRMPQFQFARGHIKPHEGETMEQAKLREEAAA